MRIHSVLVGSASLCTFACTAAERSNASDYQQSGAVLTKLHAASMANCSLHTHSAYHEVVLAVLKLLRVYQLCARSRNWRSCHLCSAHCILTRLLLII
eukprot:2862830-Amphidinium_carterae.1